MKYHVIIQEARNGGIMAEIDGRVCFPDRQQPNNIPTPEVGDMWKVEVVGQNPRGTVGFFRYIHRVTSRKEFEEEQSWKRKKRAEWEQSLDEKIKRNKEREEKERENEREKKILYGGTTSPPLMSDLPEVIYIGDFRAPIHPKLNEWMFRLQRDFPSAYVNTTRGYDMKSTQAVRPWGLRSGIRFTRSMEEDTVKNSMYSHLVGEQKGSYHRYDVIWYCPTVFFFPSDTTEYDDLRDILFLKSLPREIVVLRTIRRDDPIEPLDEWIMHWD